MKFRLHPGFQRPDAPHKCLRRPRAGGALRPLKVAVDYLRDVGRLADAPVGRSVKDEILQAEAASLIKAQAQQRCAAVEGVPDKLRAAVLQKGTIAALAQLYCARLPGGMPLLGKGAVRALAQKLIPAAHNVGVGILCSLQKQFKCPLPEQIIVVAEGDKLAARGFQPAVAGRADASVFLGDDVDAVVLAGKHMAEPGRAVGGAIVDDDDFHPRHLLGKDGLHGGAQGLFGVVGR